MMKALSSMVTTMKDAMSFIADYRRRNRVSLMNSFMMNCENGRKVSCRPERKSLTKIMRVSTKNIQWKSLNRQPMSGITFRTEYGRLRNSLEIEMEFARLQ